jgi:hypothetical protein
MKEKRDIEWSRTAVSDGRTLLADAEDGRGLMESVMQALRTVSGRGAVHDVPPEFFEIGLTHLREIRAGNLRVFYRVARARISVVGLLDARHDPGEALFRRGIRAAL